MPYVRKYYEVRANTGTPFWDETPEVKSWLDDFEKKLVDDGIILEFKREISEDYLTLTRIAKVDSLNNIDLIPMLSPVEDYRQKRMQYNYENNIVWWSEDENV